MRQKNFFFVVVFFLLGIKSTLIAQNEPTKTSPGSLKVEMYLNAATEEYLRSNFAKAVENLEKVLEIEPQNLKIKEFLVKVLSEAGEYFYLKRNYQSAYNYLGKAKKYAPDNKTIDELYNLTKSLVEKPVPEQKEPTKEITPKEEIKKPAPTRLEPKIITQERVIYLPAQEFKLSKRQFFFFLGFLSLFCFIFLLSSLIVSLRFKKLKKDIFTTTKTLKSSFDLLDEEIKNVNALQLKSSLEEKEDLERNIKLGLEKIKDELSTELKKITPKRRAKTAGESLLLQQQERILSELRGAELTPTEPTSLIEARQRMLKAAVSLYQFNPELALKSLKAMLKHENPAVRLNTVLALGEIGSAQTVSLLVDMLSDPDFGVKRTLLEILSKLKNNSFLPENIRQKIILALSEEKKKKEWIF